MRGKCNVGAAEVYRYRVLLLLLGGGEGRSTIDILWFKYLHKVTKAVTQFRVYSRGFSRHEVISRLAGKTMHEYEVSATCCMEIYYSLRIFVDVTYNQVMWPHFSTLKCITRASKYQFYHFVQE